MTYEEDQTGRVGLVLNSLAIEQDSLAALASPGSMVVCCLCALHSNVIGK